MQYAQSPVHAAVSTPDPLFIGSELFRQPAFPGNHPLNIERHAAVVDLVKILGWLPDENFRCAHPAPVETLLEFHDRSYIRALQYAESEGLVEPWQRYRYQIGTRENPLFPGLFERAAMTVGGSILAAELAMAGHVVFHPAGGTHHGRPDRASGFCYFNDPVFAIKTLVKLGCGNVLYIDFDAHHGDGVEQAFFEEERVTTLSVHEQDRWPYSGNVSHPDAGAYNLPVPAGLNDTEFDFLFRNAILPLVAADDVDALVVCCGADCLAGDPLSGMMLSNAALWGAVETLIGRQLPTVIVGGGGYNPWTVCRYWAGLWGRINARQIPDQLPDTAVRLLGEMECDLVDEEDMNPSWLTTMTDNPNAGSIRDSVKSLVRNVVT
jgi:acetoin utilization protein AcuC